ncbi:FHA domain-containing protein [Microbacterium sp. STN6]|uniref:FHA domain-containing protein n=1 Tax=Microbacterium sp. STN6 TaxID=2995588 RepID=UPI0022609FF3|nr:FHA domain-containing protein [Microbacterium sp. STN6]MCX7521187.1 FHA domain-containing protein [Microbacterium sp. STN6]
MTSGHTRSLPPSASRNWLLVCGRSFIVALGDDPAPDVIESLWALARRHDVQVEEVVALIPLAGDGAVRSFALASIPDAGSADGRTVTVVTRGTAVVDVVSIGGARRFSAAGIQPWVLADFRSVTALQIGGIEAEGDDEEQPRSFGARAPAGSLPVAEGVLHAGGALWSNDELALDDIEQTIVFVRRGSTVTDTETGTELPPESERPQASELPPELDETVIRERPLPSRQWGTPAAAEPKPEPKPEREPEPEPEPKASAPGQADFDDDTIVRAELDDTVLLRGPRSSPRPVEPGIRAETAPPTPQQAAARQVEPAAPHTPPGPTTPFGFRLLPGEPFDLDAPTFFGRNPRAPEFVAGAAPRLVRVASPTQEVSSTHLRIEPVGDSVVVTDLRSTNGTALAGPGITTTRMRPGESRAVLAGTTVDIGDGNIIEIVPGRRSTMTVSHPTRPGEDRL